MANRRKRIAIIADTHYYAPAQFPAQLLAELDAADMVIHLGDFESIAVVDYLKRRYNFHGVYGNHDGYDIRTVLPRRDIVEVNGKRLGLVHGCTVPFGSLRRMLRRFQQEKLDALLYGHTHIVRNEIKHGVLVFNPGSVMGKWPSPWSSYGILEVDGNISGEIVTLPEPGKWGAFSADTAVDKREYFVNLICGARRCPDC